MLQVLFLLFFQNQQQIISWYETEHSDSLIKVLYQAVFDYIEAVWLQSHKGNNEMMLQWHDFSIAYNKDIFSTAKLGM